MIRPVTCVCFLLACSSGLYVYQSKHRVQLIDREIEKTVHATDALREQTRVAHAEWTLLNDPQRLQVLADQFLRLKNVAPGQFTSMAELDNRLPAVSVPDPAPQDPAGGAGARTAAAGRRRAAARARQTGQRRSRRRHRRARRSTRRRRLRQRQRRRVRWSPRRRRRARRHRSFARPLRLTRRGQRRRGSSRHPCPHSRRPDRWSVPPSAWHAAVDCRRHSRCRSAPPNG